MTTISKIKDFLRKYAGQLAAEFIAAIEHLEERAKGSKCKSILWLADEQARAKKLTKATGVHVILSDDGLYTVSGYLNHDKTGPVFGNGTAIELVDAVKAMNEALEVKLAEELAKTPATDAECDEAVRVSNEDIHD